jgi:hypothetical protein
MCGNWRVRNWIDGSTEAATLWKFRTKTILEAESIKRTKKIFGDQKE